MLNNRINYVQDPRLSFHGQFFFGADYLSETLTMSLRSHSKNYIYYIARSPLSQIFDSEISPQNRIYTSIFSAIKKNCPWKRGLNKDVYRRTIVEYI